jgi:hypothetical protein
VLGTIYDKEPERSPQFHSNKLVVASLPAVPNDGILALVNFLCSC